MKTILLVEDDTFFLDVYHNQFKNEGYKVLVSKTVVSALENIKNNHPDLIVLDLNLRGNDYGPGDGLSILGEIKKDPKYKNIKIIVSSNYTIENHPELSQLPELGVVKSFIKANTSPSEIAQEIKELLK